MFWFQYQYMEWDLYRNNTLSSILWTTTFACAKLICQIKKCQTYFHTSTLPILLLEQRELMTKVHECAEFHFFLFSAKSLSQTRIIEYWALACWRTSQTKWCCHVEATSAALRPISTYILSIFTAKIVPKFGQVKVCIHIYLSLPEGYKYVHRYIPNIEGIERCSTFFLYWAFYKKYSLLSFSGRSYLFMGTQYSYQ